MNVLGNFLIFLFNAVTRPESPKILFNRTMEEAILIGIKSIFIVAIVSSFMGAVTCVQTAYNLESPFVPSYIIGTIVRDMTILELSPTVISIVLAGKVGSNIAGSLGTMKITEQVDALEVMGINSMSYLVLPKILAALMVFPMLVTLSMTLSIGGGYLAGTMTKVLTAQEYIQGLRFTFTGYNITFALIKSIVFSFIISGISSYQGYNTRGGALEVGIASTNAVTNSIIAILLADFLLAQVLL